MNKGLFGFPSAYRTPLTVAQHEATLAVGYAFFNKIVATYFRTN